MVCTDFIAAINLGTSRLTGILGQKEAGMLTVVACETENSANCIRRGCVYNVRETASKIKRIIQKMESHIPGNRIAKIYVGAGGQSIRSIGHTVYLSMDTEQMVTDEIKEQLFKEARACEPEGLDVLSVIPSAYYLDKQYEFEPAGVSCTSIEARYRLIVARPSVRKRIVECVTEQVKTDVAGIIPSPLALAEAVLNEDDRKRGCALVDFGDGVTSLTVYKNGRLADLCVIPLGGNLITTDISEYMGISFPDAEKLKQKYANAIVDKDDDTTLQANTENSEPVNFRLSGFNAVVEARLQEILENVYSRLESFAAKDLRAGILITGNASQLENLTTAIYDRLKIDVRYASIRKDLTVKTNLQDISAIEIAGPLGLLLGGNVNCLTSAPVRQPAQAAQEKPEVKTEVSPAEEPAAADDPKKSKTSRKHKSILDRINEKAGQFVGDIFNES
jgi:cell division protein FtsA